MTFFDLYKALFVIELFVAEFLFTFRLKKREKYPLRLGIAFVILFLFGFLLWDSIPQAWYSCLVFFSMFAVSIPLLLMCYREPIENILFCGMAAYTTQHLAYEASNILLSSVFQMRSPLLGMYGDDPVQLAFNQETALILLIYLLCYFSAYTVVFLIFGRKVQKGKEFRIRSTSMLLLLLAGLVVNIVLNAVVIYNDFDFVSNLVHFAMNLLCCILLLLSQFSLIRAKELEVEVQVANQLRQQERRQYTIAKENIDLINQKCHDMRYQIRQIGKQERISDGVVQEIEKAIHLYDSAVKTGNDALDILMTEKNLACIGQKITFTCVADGKLLSFMDETDLYSLFGNALDNAMEAVRKISETERRVISLKIKGSGQLVSVSLSNPYVGEIRFGENGLPQTSKGDSDYHGYGMQSIRRIVDKYDGDMNVIAENGMFYLNILFQRKRAE